MANNPAPENEPLLTDLLRAVSRSFYLTLRVLPSPVRPSISLAYLLARTSDTIADTEVLPPEDRLGALQDFHKAITTGQETQCDFTSFLAHQTRSKERTLLERVNESLALLRSTESTDRQLIIDVLETIISGQQLDLERFQNASAEMPTCLATADELDDYTYRVAGCVGEFWTRVCFRHLRPDEPSPCQETIDQGIRFGKGLQLVNILRDFQEDLAQGRCYLPRQELGDAIPQSGKQLDQEQERRLAGSYQNSVRVAEQHLQAGWRYTCALPRTWLKLRLACAWPVLLGFETLRLLPRNNPLGTTQKAKVSRSQVKWIILKTLLAAPFPPIWNRLAPTEGKPMASASARSAPRSKPEN